MSYNRKIFFGLSLLGFYSVSFAAIETVSCTDNTIFSDNECQVCYQESQIVSTTTDSLEIKNVVIPWENKQTNLSEVTYKIESVFPEIITQYKFITTPSDSEKLWKYSNGWTGNLDEYVLPPGTKKDFIEMESEGVIKVSNNSDSLSPNILIKSPIIYHERDTIKISEDEDPKTKNICLLYKISFPKTVTKDTSDSASEEIVPKTDSPLIPGKNTPDEFVEDDPKIDDIPSYNARVPSDTPSDTSTAGFSDDEIPSYDAQILNSATESPQVQKATQVETGPALNLIFIVTFVLSVFVTFLKKKFI